MGVIQGLVAGLSSVADSPAALCTIVTAVGFVYFVVLGIYRLTLHPLARFPGPKLAAFTYWYETYYEVFKSPGGQFLFHYHRLHDQYGPIIRISPDEIHIRDSSFFEEMFSNSLPWDKLEHLQYRFNNSTGTFSTPKHDAHRPRRAALNPFFSKRTIANATPMMQEKLYQLCDRLRSEYKGREKILRLDWLWGCIAADIIVQYCFNEGYGFIDAPDFRSPFIQAMFDLLDVVHVVVQFPWVGAIINALPEKLVEAVQPGMKSVNHYNREMASQISQIIAQKANGTTKESQRKTVFNTLLDSGLPPEETSLSRLQHEAITVIGAGFETTRYALAVASYHILSTPSIYNRLREELFTAIPDPSNFPPLSELEKLPYLTGCLQECIRLSYGIVQRSPRTTGRFPLVYKTWTMPPGTIISMDNYSVSHDEEIFPDSFTFKPDRWLNDPLAPDGRKLTRYLVSFGRGTRSCLGINLAYAEMYISLANVYRNFEFELFETGRESVDCYRDMFLPHAKPGTQGVRVKVL
ncbi:cytochrome P450 [Aspergillus ibericus CBS 121593]|uniref:Cytochrome P450 n=1 Tax=Aspergillus ibericus CBS 121593 TaxID=1448316 RepID=A0A395H7S6_9EURO|nr:cytochrome P450 [Aspergillus ibericus CBS 121593]RAL03205.1 cytochrome P450 [Aspergillus ibericus CBS 121593]